MEKILFLDIDGVLNCQEWYKDRLKRKGTYPISEFSPTRVELVNQITDQTGAQIVVSSSWRHRGFDSICYLFSQVKITGKVRGLTPHLDGKGIVRGNEIKVWIDDNLSYPWHADPNKDEEYRILNPDGSFKMMRSNTFGIDFNYCILDDDSDMLFEHRNNFVQTTSLLGLTPELTLKAIEIINK